MTKAGVQLATIATIQPGTAILPNGTIVSVPAGQSLQSTFGNLFSNMGAAGSYMPIFGHVLAVLDDAFSGFRSPDHVAGVPAEG